MTRKEYIDILARRLEGLDESSLRDILLEIEDHIDTLTAQHPEKSAEEVVDELESPESLADSLREAAGLEPYAERQSEASEHAGETRQSETRSSAGTSASSAKKTVRIVIDDEDVEEAIRKAFDIAKIFRRNRDKKEGEPRDTSFEIKGTELDNLRRISVSVRSTDVRVLFSNDDFSVDEVSEDDEPRLQMQYDDNGVFRIATLVGPREPDRIDLRVPASVDELNILTLSGDVHVLDRGGGLSVTTASGDVEIETCDGDIAIRTASGDVQLAQCGENVRVSTASGDISIEVDDMCNALDLSSVSGDIALTCPEGWDASFVISTVSGEIEHDGLSSGRGLVRMGKGLVPAKISTVSGDIRIDDRK